MRKLTSRAPARNRRASTPRNRKHQHLLDVKVRSRKAAQQRNRRIVTWISTIVLLTAAIGGATYGIREALTKFLWENPDYNLIHLEIVTDGSLMRDQVIEAAKIREGENIFALSLPEAREAIGELPQVEFVELRRVLPNRIDIRITERQPIAWIAPLLEEDPTTSGDAFLVDTKGVLIKHDTSRDLRQYLNLPVIVGVSMDNFRSGQPVGDPDIRAALDLVRLNIDNPRFEVRTVDLSKRYCMIVTDQRRSKITFGLERISEQLDRLSALLDYTEPRRKEIETANLMPARNVPVTFVDQEPLEVEVAEGDDASSEDAPRRIPNRVMKAIPVN
jgi:cell division septal protein FtsQ